MSADLSFVTTDELLDELSSRYAALVVLMENDTTDTNTNWRRHWSGPPSRLIGMIVRATYAVLKDDPGGT